ncbi:hypothetical protein [Paracoccus beibuensis]|uniref:hypothetical protein n=1 Tax=Paracoccus beibuensis TaxID=547602 RepID=UPI0038995D70
MKRHFASALSSTTLIATPMLVADPAAVVSHHADMAQARYSDSLKTVRNLQSMR